MAIVNHTQMWRWTGEVDDSTYKFLHQSAASFWLTKEVLSFRLISRWLGGVPGPTRIAFGKLRAGARRKS
jgi:hypothetical protein